MYRRVKEKVHISPHLPILAPPLPTSLSLSMSLSLSLSLAIAVSFLPHYDKFGLVIRGGLILNVSL